jgi:ubiquinone/menaquinone biosynthesis C-methylase UbiE
MPRIKNNSKVIDLRLIIRQMEKKFLDFFPGYLFLLRRFSFHLFSELTSLLLPHIKNGKILDIGTGHGTVPVELAKMASGISAVVGLDISENLLKRARQLAKSEGVDGKACFVRSDAHSLSFSACVFDYIVSTGSLNLWESPVEVLNEAYRVLKPGGRFWLLDQCRVKSIRELSGALFRRRFFGIGLTAYSVEEISGFIRKSRFGNCNLKIEDMIVCVELVK